MRFVVCSDRVDNSNLWNLSSLHTLTDITKGIFFLFKAQNPPETDVKAV